MIVVLGTTASGKSQLAVRLAERFGGEIIGCDSMQVYRGFDCGTGKPTLQMRARVPHHLIDVADPSQDFNLGDYVRGAEAVVEALRSSGRRPIIVGGTGLYLQGLLRGIFEGPRRDTALRERLGRIEARWGAPSLHRVLRRVDPQAARRLPDRDTQRIVRALEVYFATGRRLSDYFETQGFGADRWPAVKIGLTSPRDVLLTRIAQRIEEFFAAGWEDEVRRLLASGLSEQSNAWKALGYREVVRLVRGEVDGASARETILRDTRRYAKRQRTWFRREPGVTWFEHCGEPPWEAIEGLAARDVY